MSTNVNIRQQTSTCEGVSVNTRAPGTGQTRHPSRRAPKPHGATETRKPLAFVGFLEVPLDAAFARKARERIAPPDPAVRRRSMLRFTNPNSASGAHLCATQGPIWPMHNLEQNRNIVKGQETK
jgi:hypothetical protein